MILHFEIIPHKRQRYDTVGDWWKRKGRWYFAISKMKDKRYCWLVFLHEVIEWAICQLTGVKAKDVDRFDMDYERSRPGLVYDYIRAAAEIKANITGFTPCGCKHRDDPGDDIHAPYHEAHAVANQCEQLIAKALGVDWVKYDEAVMRL